MAALLVWILSGGLGAHASPPRAGRAPLEILTPAADTLLLSPEVEVVVRMTPRLAAHEELRLRLFAAVDAPDAPILVRDLADRAVLSHDGRILRLRIDDLPPGRSTLELRRRGDDDAGFSVSRVLDRGGFASDGELYHAGVLHASLGRASTLEPSRERVLGLLVWYPTHAHEAPDPHLHAVPDAPLPHGAAALPTLVYSHGNCGSADAFTTLASSLARAGFVVASISHTGDTRADPGCGEIRNQAISFFERPDDVTATLDWLEKLPGSAGLLVDPARMGLAGHSFGAQTTLRTARFESRLRAALALAPPLQATAGSLPLPVPTMIQGGSLDTTTPFDQQQQLFDLLLPPRLLVELLGEGHSAFTDAADAPTRARILRYALGFLGTYLAADARWDALLAPGEGVVLQSDRAPLPALEACRNGLDDDADGLVDAPADPGCETPEGASELPRHDLRIALRGRPGRTRGIVTVLLLGHPGLDLDELDPASLAFGPGGARLLHAMGPHGAGARRVAHFRAAEALLAPSDAQACLRGEIAREPFVACAALSRPEHRGRGGR